MKQSLRKTVKNIAALAVALVLTLTAGSISLAAGEYGYYGDEASVYAPEYEYDYASDPESAYEYEYEHECEYEYEYECAYEYEYECDYSPESSAEYPYAEDYPCEEAGTDPEAEAPEYDADAEDTDTADTDYVWSARILPAHPLTGFQVYNKGIDARLYRCAESVSGFRLCYERIFPIDLPGIAFLGVDYTVTAIDAYAGLFEVEVTVRLASWGFSTSGSAVAEVFSVEN